MARLSAAKLEVNEEQQAELEAIVRKRTSAQRLVVRARIILLAMAGVGVHETMRRLSIVRTTVQIWRRRWREADQHLSLDLPSKASRSLSNSIRTFAIVY